MPRGIFSSRINVGDRVVVRRRLGGLEGPETDVIGHVLSLEPLVVRPQKVGGLPSSAPAIDLSGATITALRRMQPRRVRNSEIRAVERALAAAEPADTRRFDSAGGWLMSAGGPGGAIAAPLGHSASLGRVPIEEIEAFAAEAGERPRLLIPERIGRPAEALAAAGGWALSAEEVAYSRREPPAEEPRPIPGLRLSARRAEPDRRAAVDAAGRTPAEATLVAGGEEAGPALVVRILPAPAGHPSGGDGASAAAADALARWGAARGAELIVAAAEAGSPEGGALRAAGFGEHHRRRVATAR